MCSSKFKNCTSNAGINSSNPVVINDTSLTAPTNTDTTSIAATTTIKKWRRRKAWTGVLWSIQLLAYDQISCLYFHWNWWLALCPLGNESKLGVQILGSVNLSLSNSKYKQHTLKEIWTYRDKAPSTSNWEKTPHSKYWKQYPFLLAHGMCY